MAPPPLPATSRDSFIAATVRSAKRLHRTSEHWRYAAEAGIIGLLLLCGLAVFGPQQTGSGSGHSAPASSYSAVSPASPAQASTGNSSGPPSSANPPSISLQQLQQIRQQSGNSNVISTLPIKIAPAMKAEDVVVEQSSAAVKDEPGLFRGQKKEISPAIPSP
ncbi:MAG: hypothetical protein ABI680_15905 [Chthoniobacteraceae bacterium]